jgi:phage tail protein X
MATSTSYIVVKPGERLDMLAYRVYGDCYQYPLLIAANPRLDIWNPQAGMTIEVPSAE